MIAAIILAAGESRRMGAQKVLLPYAGGTIISHIVGEFARSRVDDVFVVVGHQPEGIVAALAGTRARVVPNTEYQEGMLSSVRCGLRALSLGTDWTFVALGDQPSVATALIDQMAKAALDCEKKILVPIHHGRRGHPLLFSTAFRDDILARYDDQGLRGLLHAHPEEVQELAVDSSSVLDDMDLPSDYSRAIARQVRGNSSK